MSWRLAKVSCTQIIVSAISCLDKRGFTTSGNQQNFTLFPTFMFPLFSSTFPSTSCSPRKVHCWQWTWPSYHHQGNNVTVHLHKLGNKNCYLCYTIRQVPQKWSVWAPVSFVRSLPLP